MVVEWLFIVSSRIVPRAATKVFEDEEKACGKGKLLLHDSQRPSPAGKLAGHGDVGDHRLLLSCVERLPTLVQPFVAVVTAQPRLGGGQFPTVPHRLTRDPVGLGVMP